MYDDIIDLAMDQQLLTEINNQIDYRALPIWRELQLRGDEELKTLEQKLNSNENLAFDHVFREPIGFYFIKSYLQTQHSVDKAVFIRDVAVYKTLIHPEARKEALGKIFETFCGPELPDRIQGTSALIDINASGHLKSATQSVDGTSSRWSTNNDNATTNEIITNYNNDINPNNNDDEEDPEQSGTITITNLSNVNDTNKPNNLTELNEEDEEEQKVEKIATITNFVPNQSDNASINNDNNHLEKINIAPSNEDIEQQTNTQIVINTTISNSLNPLSSENANADVSISNVSKNTKSCSPNPSSVNVESASSKSVTDSSFSNASPFFSDNSNAIGCYGKSLKKLKRRMGSGECDINIFDDVVGEILNDLKLDVFPRFLKSKMFDMYLRCKLMEDNVIGMESFHLMRMLGRGAFGSVNACKKKDTGRLYAMKQIDKRRVQATDSVHSLIAERDFLSLMDSRFVTSLKYAFLDQDKLYFIMDLMTGGDLKYHLNHDGFFEENRSRYYCAQILLGLEHIHGKGIIYRDLKLENVLVDEQGNLKISDLGLAVSINDGLVRGYAGTPGYTAPEVVLTQYYDQQVDFFSFGVVIYRTICGKKPFATKKNHGDAMRRNEMDRVRKTSIELDRNVVEMLPPFESVRFTPKIKNLCRGLLSKNSKYRLGINGYDEIKEHPWFDCIDWGLLEAGYLKPPFVPACDEIHAEQQQCIGRPPDDDKYSKVKVSNEFNQSLLKFEFKSAKVIQAEIVEVLEKVYSERPTDDDGNGGNGPSHIDIKDLYTFPTGAVEVGGTSKQHCLSCVIA